MDNILTQVLPMLLGGIFLMTLRRYFKCLPLPLLCCAGAYLGFVMLGALVEVSKALTLSITGEEIIKWSWCLVAGLVIINTISYRRQFIIKLRDLKEVDLNLKFPEYGIAILILSCAVVVFCLPKATHILHSPIQGWDVLGSWAYHAKQAIKQAFDVGLIKNYGENQNHPSVSTTLLGWSVWGRSQSGMTPVVTWFVAGFLLLITTMTYGAKQANLLVGTIMGSVLCSLPLLENHIVILGYSEIWLVLSLMTSCAIIALALDASDKNSLLLGIAVASLCIWTRKTGALYFVLVLSALFLLSVSRWGQRRAKVGFAIGVVAMSVLFIRGFSIYIAEGVYAVWKPEDMTLFFAGRVLHIEWHGHASVLWNEYRSKILNSSFSVIPFASAICLAWISKRWLTKSVTSIHNANSLMFLAGVFVTGTLVLVFAQLLTDAAFLTFSASSDTSGSRAYLPLIGVAALLVTSSIGSFLPSTISDDAARYD